MQENDKRGSLKVVKFRGTTINEGYLQETGVYGNDGYRFHCIHVVNNYVQ